MEIAFIAPYELIRTKAQSIIATNGYPARTFLGDLQDGVVAARQAMEDGAHIIISRGGTARLIRDELNIDVIEVGASYLQLLSFIQEQTSLETRIAIVGFRQFANLAQPVCDILKRPHQVFEIKENELIEEVFERVTKWHADIVIGDAVSVKAAEKYSINFHLIESSMETIVDAFERGMLVVNNLNKHIANNEKLAAVLNCTKEGAMLVNGEGVIEEINQRGCNLLNNFRTRLINSRFQDFLKSEELDDVAKAHKTAKNILVPFDSKRFATDYIVISPKDAQGSAVIRFQQVERIQEAGEIIRKKLLDKGFYAKYRFRDIQHQCVVMKQLIEIARLYSNTTSNIILQGETGTGKELFAQSIHNASPIAEGPFVAVNCAALSGSLLESELFGYAPGAFTGALKSGKTGLFELAHNGTLFLDEITEMDTLLQSKLLRALQAREIMRIGDNKVIPVNVRVIAATNRNPKEEIQSGKLRADLYFRLNVLDLIIPPLRERKNDAVYLFNHYILKNGKRTGMQVQPISETLARQLTCYSWPGNVRELENLAEKYISLHDIPQREDIISATLVEDLQEENGGKDHLQGSLNEIIIRTVDVILKQEDGNISKTADRLQIDRNTVKRWLAKKNL